MIFPNATFEEWIQKYPSLLKLEEEEDELSICPECQNKVIPDQPYIEKNYVGLISFNCHFCKTNFKTDFSICISSPIINELGELV